MTPKQADSLAYAYFKVLEDWDSHEWKGQTRPESMLPTKKNVLRKALKIHYLHRQLDDKQKVHIHRAYATLASFRPLEEVIPEHQMGKIMKQYAPPANIKPEDFLTVPICKEIQEKMNRINWVDHNDKHEEERLVSDWSDFVSTSGNTDLISFSSEKSIVSKYLELIELHLHEVSRKVFFPIEFLEASKSQIKDALIDEYLTRFTSNLVYKRSQLGLYEHFQNLFLMLGYFQPLVDAHSYSWISTMMTKETNPDLDYLRSIYDLPQYLNIGGVVKSDVDSLQSEWDANSKVQNMKKYLSIKEGNSNATDIHILPSFLSRICSRIFGKDKKSSIES